METTIWGLGFRVLGFTYTPKVCKTMAFMPVIRFRVWGLEA